MSIQSKYPPTLDPLDPPAMGEPLDAVAYRIMDYLSKGGCITEKSIEYAWKTFKALPAYAYIEPFFNVAFRRKHDPVLIYTRFKDGFIAIVLDVGWGNRLTVRAAPNWDVPIKMICSGTSLWQTETPLPPGTQYKFLFNDIVWEPGPNRTEGVVGAQLTLSSFGL